MGSFVVLDRRAPFMKKAPHVPFCITMVRIP